MLSWVKHLLGGQQKSDFKPEEIKPEESSTASTTNVCVHTDERTNMHTRFLC